MNELYIDTPGALAQLCVQLAGQTVIAIDTEFMREKTYYAKPCLFQLAALGVIACVDPLKLDDLRPLFDIVYDHNVVKVIHSARQDLEIFYDLNSELPKPIFDTQVAAALLGYGDQLGYAKLVKAMLGVTLDKTQTRTDWTLRPLDDKQIRYALDDVRYLLEIYRSQQQQLKEMGRLHWLENDFNKLSDTRLYRMDPESLWQKVRGVNTLKGVQLAALKALTNWRENYAMEANRPRRWIMRDDILIELARHMPKTDSDLERIRGWDNGIRRHSMTVLSLIDDARTTAEPLWPKLTHVTTLTLNQEALVDAMMGMVKTRAAENNVTAALLTNRKELERLVTGHDDVAVNSGWRRALVGKDLEKLLNGQTCLHISDGVLQVEDADSS